MPGGTVFREGKGEPLGEYPYFKDCHDLRTRQPASAPAASHVLSLQHWDRGKTDPESHAGKRMSVLVLVAQARSEGRTEKSIGHRRGWNARCTMHGYPRRCCAQTPLVPGSPTFTPAMLQGTGQGITPSPSQTPNCTPSPRVPPQPKRGGFLALTPASPLLSACRQGACWFTPQQMKGAPANGSAQGRSCCTPLEEEHHPLGCSPTQAPAPGLAPPVCLSLAAGSCFGAEKHCTTIKRMVSSKPP